MLQNLASIAGDTHASILNLLQALSQVTEDLQSEQGGDLFGIVINNATHFIISTDYLSAGWFSDKSLAWCCQQNNRPSSPRLAHAVTIPLGSTPGLLVQSAQRSSTTRSRRHGCSLLQKTCQLIWARHLFRSVLVSITCTSINSKCMYWPLLSSSSHWKDSPARLLQQFGCSLCAIWKRVIN